jgi:ADP-ribose pyrophosphatase YjhB (NUDIX family)
MRLRITRLAYRIAWRAMRLAAPLHHGRGRGVKAILTHDGELLLVQHTYGPRRWELPGGGLRRGESPLEGIRRELREELAVEIRDLRLIAYGSGSGRQVNRAISVFAAELPSRAVTPDAREIERAEWYLPDALPARLGWQVAASVDAFARGGAGAPVDLGRKRGAS